MCCDLFSSSIEQQKEILFSPTCFTSHRWTPTAPFVNQATRSTLRCLPFTQTSETCTLGATSEALRYTPRSPSVGDVALTGGGGTAAVVVVVVGPTRRNAHAQLIRLECGPRKPQPTTQLSHPHRHHR
jgi:hypothetical protein